MSQRLLLDEDIFGAVAVALKARGFDVLRIQEAGTSGNSDPDQLALAVSLERVFVTFNRGDFTRLHCEYVEQNRHHFGILTCPQVPVGELLRRILKALDENKDLRDRIMYVR